MTYDVLRKDCNSDTKDVYIYTSLLFRVLSIAASGLAKTPVKLDKVF